MKRLSLACILLVALVLGAAAAPTQALTYPQLILQSGPERYSRLNETSGVVVADLATGVNGSYTASIVLSQSGAIYDGDTSILTSSGMVTYPSIGIVNHSYACEGWFHVASTPANNAVRSLCRIASGSTEDVFINLQYQTATGYRILFDHITSSLIPYAITPDTWHHYVMQYNYASNTAEVYLDAVLIASMIDTPFTTPNSSLTIGNSSSTMTLKIDELAFYRRVLTQGEINSHYAAAASAPVTATPTITETPSNTATPTSTPTATPGWDYAITLPSGQQASVKMEVSSGDLLVTSVLMLATAVLIAALYLWRRKNNG
jgi:hypothetical protein